MLLQSCIGTIAFTRREGYGKHILETLRFCTLAFFNALIISTDGMVEVYKMPFFG